MLLLATFILALSRAEIIERLKAPVVTHSGGFVQVYAGCPEDMRREYQTPVARFASDTVALLEAGTGMKPAERRPAGIVVHIGDVRTNVADVVARVSTNGTAVATRIYLPAPGFASLDAFREEVGRAFFRRVAGREAEPGEVAAALRRADPAARAADRRKALDLWLDEGKGTDEDGFKLMRSVITPGVSSKREVLIFASRLRLYPPQYDLRFPGGRDSLSMREALGAAKSPLVRIAAAVKANSLPLFAGGRSPKLAAAAAQYAKFLYTIARGDAPDEKLRDILDEADVLLNQAYEEAT